MSSIFNQSYVNITYKSKSDYPYKLCKHIVEKYNIKSGSKILDIGCGNGEITKSFRELGMEVYGIDISESSLINIENSNFKKHDLSNHPYPYEDESFDYIFSKSVIEHMNEPDILIDEAFRLLKKNGMFICMTPSWKHSYQEAFYIDHTHVTPFIKHSLEVICELSGFKARCEYFYQLPIMWKFPILNFFRFIIQKLPIPYRPFSNIKWPDKINKTIRFSKEAMLLCICIK